MSAYLEETIQFKAPAGFLAALTVMARREYYGSVSELIRRVMIEKVREAGITIPPDENASNSEAAA